MFIFGSPEDLASTFVDSVSREGPGLPEAAINDQNEEQLRTSLVIVRLAVKSAFRDDADADTKRILVAWHDSVFRALLDRSESFRKHCLDNGYNYPRIKTKDLTGLYKFLVEEAVELASES